jgi:uncharacterized protein
MSHTAHTADPLAGLMAYAGAEGDDAQPLPPVHLWNPAHCGAIDIRIARDGTWLHEGQPITRPALVRLFSTVLRRDVDGYVLVTPAEKLAIQVEDAPFVAVRMERTDAGLLFRTNVGDAVLAGPDHPLRVDSTADGAAPRPYLHVRGGLEARLSRPVFYELAEVAEARDGVLGVESGGAWFPLGSA